MLSDKYSPADPETVASTTTATCSQYSRDGWEDSEKRASGTNFDRDFQVTSIVARGLNKKMKDGGSLGLPPGTD